MWSCESTKSRSVEVREVGGGWGRLCSVRSDLPRPPQPPDPPQPPARASALEANFAVREGLAGMAGEKNHTPAPRSEPAGEHLGGAGLRPRLGEDRLQPTADEGEPRRAAGQH